MSSEASLDASASLPGAYAYELAVHCRRWSVAPETLLDATGLTLDALKDPATRLSLATCATLVERARRATGEPGLAFTMGLGMRLSWHGFLGFAAMAAGTVGEALQLAERFSLTRTAAFSLTTHVEGSVASLVIEERAGVWSGVPSGSAGSLQDLGSLREFVLITLLVGMGRIAQDVTGRRMPGVAECAFPEPDYAAAMLARARSLDAGTMVFGRPSHRLVFDASLLEVPLTAADPAAMQLAREQCDRELAALSDAASLAGRVRAEVARCGPRASIERVARGLGASTRTLKRRLAEQGTSFRAITDEARRQKALLLLDDRRLPLTEVADRLGYSDLANFARAFRRWTGKAPGAFRGR